jgi:hypothetical protein
MSDAEPSNKPKRGYRKHGLTKLLESRHGSKAMKVDGRTRRGKALAKHRADLLASLGGEGNLSAQELTLVKLCVREMVYVDEIDIELFTHGIFNKRKRQVHALLTQRMPIANGIGQRLKDLGLERRVKPITVLDYAKSKTKPPTEKPAPPPSPNTTETNVTKEGTAPVPAVDTNDTTGPNDDPPISEVQQEVKEAEA